MITNDQKATEVLTRCGQWSHVGAQSFLKDLLQEEIVQLAELHDCLAAADDIGHRSRTAVGAVRPKLTDEETAQLAKAANVGDRYRQWIDAVADRRLKITATLDEELPAVSASLRPAVAPLIGTGEP